MSNTEDASKIEFGRHMPKLEGTELVAYRQRVEQVLTGLFDTNSKLRADHGAAGPGGIDMHRQAGRMRHGDAGGNGIEGADRSAAGTKHHAGGQMTGGCLSGG